MPNLFRTRMNPIKIAMTTSVAKKLPVDTNVTTVSKTRTVQMIIRIPLVPNPELDGADVSVGSVDTVGGIGASVGCVEGRSVDGAPVKLLKSGTENPNGADISQLDFVAELDVLINCLGDNKSANAFYPIMETL